VKYVTDTHAFLWHLYLPARLGIEARAAFSAADSGDAIIHIPAVVLAEILMVVQRGRLSGVTLAQLLPHLESISGSRNYSLSALHPGTILGSHALMAIPDIFDRLIVAEAIERATPLISRDGIIKASGLVALVWD
jgi:PIN domain nuclease of toxin-antitoxin system